MGGRSLRVWSQLRIAGASSEPEEVGKSASSLKASCDAELRKQLVHIVGFQEKPLGVVLIHARTGNRHWQTGVNAPRGTDQSG